MCAERSVGHAAIVGMGIVGVATAIRLQRAGWRVSLIDREGPAAGASFGNGGVLASCAIVPVTTPGLIAKAPRMLFDPTAPLFLRWGYLPKLAPWLVRFLSHANAADANRIADALAPIVGDSLNDHLALATGTGAERYVVPSDYLYVYPDAAARDADGFTWAVRARHGFVPEALDAAALGAFDPAFAGSGAIALKLGGHGRISDPGAYVAALAAHAQAQGARVVIAEAEAVVRGPGGAATGVRLRGRDERAETLEADAVVIATGAWSGALTRDLGLRIPLESERGYHLELWEPSVMPRAPMMIAAGKFVATPMEGRLRLAGVVEFGGLEAGPARAPFDLLRRGIKAAMPGLRWAEEREWMGHRPAPSDSIPLIGPVPGAPGAWLAFGHHHVGLTGGPRTGQLLAQMIAGERSNIDLAVYAPSRFQ